MPTYKVNTAILDKAQNETKKSFDYHFNATCFLCNFLESDQQLIKSELFKILNDLLKYWSTSPEKRESDNIIKHINSIMEYGIVGKALYLLKQPTTQAQFKKELLRYANRPDELIGNNYLFYLVGLLAEKGYTVNFVPESGIPTPDLEIQGPNGNYFIEANARQPRRIIDNSTQVQTQIKTLIEEKRIKFRDTCFRPGIIAGEVSPLVPLFNNKGQQRALNLDAKTIRHLSSGTTIYDLSQDNDWHNNPDNIGGVFQYLTEEFSLQDTDNRLDGVFLSISREIYQKEDKLAYPRAGLLILDQNANPNLYEGLVPQIYMIDKSEVQKRLS